MVLEIPKTLYPKIAVLKAAYNFTEYAYIYISQNEQNFIINFTPKNEDLKLTEEEFNSLKTSFNVPHIGKFYCTYDRYLRIKNKLKKSRDAKDFEV